MIVFGLGPETQTQTFSQVSNQSSHESISQDHCQVILALVVQPLSSAFAMPGAQSKFQKDKTKQEVDKDRSDVMSDLRFTSL